MLDIKFIRENKNVVQETLKNRNCKFDLEQLLVLDETRRQMLQEVEELRAYQNKLSSEIQMILRGEGERVDLPHMVTQDKIEKSKEVSSRIKDLDEKFKEVNEDYQKRLLTIPNIVSLDIPVGDASNNKVVKEHGDLKKFTFSLRNHIDLGQDLDIIDFKRATKISGANFILLKKQGALLERALINFMLDLHTRDHGYAEILPPFLVNRAAMTGTGQLPNLEQDMYRLSEDDIFLIPTAEVPVTNLHSNEILEEKDLPIYYTAYTACFRREAGSYGKDTRGLMRVHQFNKVELVKFVKPQGSYDELEKLVRNACRVLELLGIPYRVVLLATGDISFAAAKCYDIEIYAPGIDKWLEVSSCSNFEDFQARRANVKYREKETGKVKFVHTLNGSGVALPRLVVAIIENYQQQDGSIVIPEILRPYLGGLDRIS